MCDEFTLLSIPLIQKNGVHTYTAVFFINTEFLSIIVSIIVGVFLLKTTIAIKGMEVHALRVLDSIKDNDLVQARINLAMIVKRNTK